ncbi:MAG: response regulator [Dehalococcoidia bacterium]|nr:MAG: response regulator [Dehalococcoidia bacterium]
MHARGVPLEFPSFGAAAHGIEVLRPLAATILVVDDDDPVRVMLARLLRTQGYDVRQAANAAEARTVLDEGRPDLVISDIVMPGESGIELRRGILDRWPGLPVILISGYSAEGPAEFSARTPDTIFVQKPFAADEFLALVQQTLAGAASPP